MPKKASSGAASTIKVDWKTMKGARGGASRVPALIKSLIEGKTEADRKTAYWGVTQALYGDGAVAPAAAPAVALLCEVLASKQEGAHRAAWIVGEALTAGHERVLSDASASVGGPIADVHEAVGAARDVLLTALADPDERVRAGAAFALAWAPQLADASRAALRRQLDAETGDAAKLSELLALALLGKASPAPDDARLVKDAGGSSSPVVRGGAALASLLLTSKPSPADGAEAVASLLQSTIDPEVLPWGEGNASRLFVDVATRVGARSELAVAVGEKLDTKAPAATWTQASQALLELGDFKKQWREREVALPEELSATQKAIATTLAHKDGVEGIVWGLPRSGRDRRRWLGVSAPGPLEKRIAFRDAAGNHEWPVWKVWRTVVGDGKVTDFPPPVLEALSPDEIPEAFAEVCIGAYMITFNKARPSVDPVVAATAKATPRAAEWAHRFTDEVFALVAAKSVPELGGALGMSGTEAVWLAVLQGGGPIDPRLYDAFPLASPVARVLLGRVSAAQAEEIVWHWMNQPRMAQFKAGSVRGAIPVLDLVPSKRIAAFLIEALTEPATVQQVGGPPGAEKFREMIKSVGEKHPAVAAAFD